MVKKMKLFSSSWVWPSCNQQPKTLSFRVDKNNVVFKSINSTSTDVVESLFTEFGSFSIASDEDNDPIEKVIRELRSDRLFFEPKDTSSILESSKLADIASSSASASDPFKDTMVLPMDSRNPYKDFKISMEEMVETHGVNDWERLEELLSCYLKVNDKRNHGYIVDAFVDLVAPRAVAVAASTSSSSSSHITPNSSPLSFYSSSMPSSCSTPCALRLGKIKEDEIMPEDYPSSSSTKYPNYYRK